MPTIYETGRTIAESVMHWFGVRLSVCLVVAAAQQQARGQRYVSALLYEGWLRSTVVERRSLSHAGLAADG